MTRDTAIAAFNRRKTLWAISILSLMITSITFGESATIRATATVASPFGYYDAGKLSASDQFATSQTSNPIIISGCSSVLCSIDVGEIGIKEFMIEDDIASRDHDNPYIVPLDSIPMEILVGGNTQPIVITFFYSEN